MQYLRYITFPDLKQFNTKKKNKMGEMLPNFTFFKSVHCDIV